MKTLFITLSAVALVGMSTPAAARAVDDTISADHQTSQAKSTPTGFKKKPKPGAKARCPVMKGEFVIKANSKLSYYKGRYYFFCCPGCKPKFDANPSKYAGR